MVEVHPLRGPDDQRYPGSGRAHADVITQDTPPLVVPFSVVLTYQMLMGGRYARVLTCFSTVAVNLSLESAFLIRLFFQPCDTIACFSLVSKFMVILQCFSSQVFAARKLFHASLAHRVCCWCWGAAVCSTGLAQAARGSWRPSSHSDWGERLGQHIDAMDRSVDELGPDPPAWWRRGQPMHTTMAAVAEHVVVQEGIASVAEPAGVEPAAAGDGAGDDEPVELVPLEVTEWFCSLARVKRDWAIAQCIPFAKKSTPIQLRAPLLVAHAPWNP